MIQRASIKSAPAVLNIGDKAMWVTGWNEAVDALEAEQAQGDRNCPTCGEDAPFQGGCGGGRNNPKSLCYDAKQAQIDNLRIQLARGAVERDMAIQMAACGEQAHTVEPCLKFIRMGEPGTSAETISIVAIAALPKDGALLYTAPPPAEPTVKQPLSTERAALIARLREAQAMLDYNPVEAHDAMGAAADMLEADGTFIDEGTKAQQVAVPALAVISKTEITQILEQAFNAMAPMRGMIIFDQAMAAIRGVLTAPQPPQGYIPTHGQAFQFLHDRDNSAKCFLSAIADLTAERDLLLNKKSQQVAVPMNMSEIFVAAGAQHIDVYVASFMCGIRAAEAHHGITPQGDKK